MKYQKAFFSILVTVILSAASGAFSSIFIFSYLQGQNAKNLNSDIDFFGKISPKKIFGERESEAFSDAFVSAKSALVEIYNTSKKLHSYNDYLGAGVVLTSDGWIATTNQVVGERKIDALKVVYEGKEYAPEEHLDDYYSKIIYFKISADNLSVATFPPQLQDFFEGETVYSVSPISGISAARISNLHYRDYFSDFIESSNEINEYIKVHGAYDEFFRGAVALDEDGEVLGIHFDVSGSGVSDSLIPSFHIERGIQDILNQKRILRPYLGLEYIDLSRVAGVVPEGLLQKNRGIYIASEPKYNSPAQTAEFHAGDIITEINSVDISQIKSFSDILQEYDVGDKLVFTRLRKGEVKKIEVFLGSLDKNR